ncbi:MAG: DUF2442 domain-containing protein [Pseudobdellovibrionaceae bacterium]
MILKVKEFNILHDYQLKVTFNNGETRIVNLANELRGEVFEPLKNPELFKQAYLTEWNVIEWPNGADFAPEFLFEIGYKAS